MKKKKKTFIVNNSTLVLHADHLIYSYEQYFLKVSAIYRTTHQLKHQMSQLNSTLCNNKNKRTSITTLKLKLKRKSIT